MVRTRLVAITGLVAAVTLLTAAPATAADTVRLYARLSGSQEVPPNSSPGVGDATVYVYPDNTVCTVLRVSGLTSPVTAAHIHFAPPGQAGPIVLPLTPPVNGFSYSCSEVSSTLANGLRDNPSAYYVNVHTTKYPGGEVRGQLHRA